MKRFKTLLAFAIGILATAVFGACSCTKDSTISVTSLTLTTQVANSTKEDGKLMLDVIVGDNFEITYTLAPKAATNTKVFVDVVGGSAYLVPEANIFENGTSYSVKFTARAKDATTDDATSVEVKFSSESANHSASAIVRIHKLPEVLATPQNLKYSDGQLTWDTVEHADKYIVAINGKDYFTPSTTFTPVLNTAVENVVNITAVSENIKYANGQASTSIKIFPLATPEIISSDNGVLEWSTVNNATKYILSINGTDYELDSEVLNYDVKELGLDSYDISLKAVFKHLLATSSTPVDGSTPYIDKDGCLYYVLSSESSASKTINRLSAPTNLKITNNNSYGILNWDSVAGAMSYTISGNNGSDFQFTTTDTYFDFANAQNFDYNEGKYALTVKANGLASNTITDSSSISQKFDFVKLDYLSGEINMSENILNIDVSDLYGYGLNSETVSKIKYEIIFVADDQTSVVRNKNISIVSDSATVQLATSKIASGVYRKAVVRPYVDDENLINVASATKTNIIDEIPKYVGRFTKLPNAVINNITKESVLKLNIDSSDVDTFEIVLDDTDTQIISKDAEYVQIVDDLICIDMTSLDFGFGQRSLSAGQHSISVRAQASDCVDADVSSAQNFVFTKLSSTSNITVSSNKLTWSGVQNNSGYKVEFNTSSDTVYENLYLPNTITDVNIAKVTVLGNDVDVINSDTVTNNQILRADKVENISLIDGALTWDKQTGSVYTVRVYSEGVLQSEKSITSNIFDSFNLTKESSISIIRRVAGKFDSLESNYVKIQQRSTVSAESIKIVDNAYKLTYKNGESTPILVKVVNSSGVVNSQKYDFSSQTWKGDNATINLNSAYFDVGLNYVSIIKLGQDDVENVGTSQTYYVKSMESESVEVEVLPVLSHNVENGVLSTSIASKNNPKSMTINISSASFNQTVNVENKMATFDLSSLASGTYNVVAKANANVNTNVINGSDVLFEVTKISETALKVVGGSVVFDKISGATDYVVKLYNSQGEYISNLATDISGEQGVVNIDSTTISAGVQYSITISVRANSQINSNESSERKIQKLTTVQNFAKQSNMLTWQNVENNNGYILSGQNGFVYANTATTDATSIELQNANFATAGRYKISISACGNTTTTNDQVGYLNGDNTTLDVYKLNNPTNISLSNGILSWDNYTPIGQENIEDTIITITVGDTPYTYNCGTDTTLDLNNKSELAENGFTISIQFKGNGNDTIDSDIVGYGDETVVSRLNSPVLSVSGGELCFNKVENTARYLLYVKESDTKYTLVGSENYTLQDKDTYYVVKFNNTSLIANATLNIVVKSEISDSDTGTKIDSFYSDAVQVSKLRLSDAGLRIDEYNGVSGRIVWDSVQNATNYTLYIDGTEFDQKIVVSGSATEYFDISSLNLNAGVYFITIRADGNSTTSETTNYLNSDISNSVKISLKSDSIKIRIENDILKWDSVEGVDSYKVTISSLGQSEVSYVQESANNEYLLKDNAFINDGGQTYNICVVPYKMQSSYYLVKSSSPVYLQILKAYDVFDLKISHGEITWKVNTSAISTKNEINEFVAYYTRYRDNADAIDTEQDIEKYQKYFPYFNFQIVLNGVVSNIIPTSYQNDPTDLNYMKFFYTLTEPVTTNTRYEINVRSRGNSNVVKDNNVVNTVVATISSNLLSKNLVAYKTTVPSGVVAQDGKITFNLVTTGDSSKPYIQKYKIYAVPQAQGLSTLEYTLDISDDYLNNSPAPSTYTFNVKEWVKSESSFQENILYNYQICVYGSLEGDADSTETLYLRSNFYSTIGMTFLSSINVNYLQSKTLDGVEIGAVVTWSIISTNESMTHILYILPESKASKLGDDWWKSDDVIQISLDSKTNYFDFSSEEAKTSGIQSGVLYRVAAKYGGDERSFITNDNTPQHICVETLPTTTFTGSQVQGGIFVWDEISGVSKYKITLYEKVGETVSKSVVFSNTNSYAIVSNTNQSTQYAIGVVPFGYSSSTKNYVNGFANNISQYYSLINKANGLSISVIDGQNTLTWASVDGATDYTVMIGETQYNTSSTSTRYVLPEFSAGEYTIKVMANATSGYLNGVYSDAIRVRKLYNPVLKVQNGIVSWSNGNNADLVLASASTVLKIQACNSAGVITTGGTNNTITLSQTDGLTYVLNDQYAKGYYKISVKYDVALVSSGSVSEYQLSSEESTMVSYKLDAVTEFAQGKYVKPTDTTRECDFDNYIKWKKVENAYGYLVRLLDGEGNLLDSNTKQIVYQSNIMTGDTDYFQDCTDNDYICFNLERMQTIRVSNAHVEVTVLGNSTTNNNIVGYLNSDTSQFEVEIPQGAPLIVSCENGVIRWKGAYDLTAEGEVITEYSSEAIACNVEIEFSGAIQYGYNADSNTRYEDGDEITSNHVWEYAEGKEQVFYCPYASNSGIRVRVRYYNTNYVSAWTPYAEITSNDLFVSGLGTESDPYIIAKLSNDTEATYQNRILNIKYRPNSYFQIKHDVSLTGVVWNTINNFGGVIDGENHSISNITLNDNNISMFGTLSSGAQIKNISFVDIALTSSRTSNVAPIAITNNGTISNVTISGYVNSLTNNVNIIFGGMVLTNNGTIQNSTVSYKTQVQNKVGVNISSTQNSAYVGGFVHSNNGIIKDCVLDSSITVSIGNLRYKHDGFVGGIAYTNSKVNEDSVISNCKVLQSSTLTATSIGGVVYSNGYNAIVSHCSMEAKCVQNTVVGNEGETQLVLDIGYFGGLVAINNGYVQDSYVNLTDLTFKVGDSTTLYVGLLVGFMNAYDTTKTGELSNCYILTGSKLNLPDKSGTNNKIGYVVGCINSQNDCVENIYVENKTIIYDKVGEGKDITLTNTTDFETWKSDNNYD